MVTKGGKPRWGGDGGVLNWAIGIDMYTLMCIKLMTNKYLQYKKTNKTTNTKLSLGYLYGNMLIYMFQTLHEISKNLIYSGIMLYVIILVITLKCISQK